MEQQKKSRKPLVVGIIAVVVILGILLALLLTQCTGGRDGDDGETTAQTTTTPNAAEAAGYTLYWNVDRALYDGKSEAGMSSREPEADGYFHIRFFKEGEMVTLKVAERKIVNAIEVQDLMGLEFDADGIVIGVIALEDLPCQKLAWQFYVQSAGGKLMKLNSSNNLKGMEVLLETSDKTLGIWDMTGLSGDVGCDAELSYLDRVMIIGNENGDVTHVYIYDRSEYMRTHEGECQHCGKVVTWYEWTKTNALPTTTGHYQLMNNVDALTVQQALVEDAKVCLDLNGMAVDGADNRRVYTLHNSGTSLAIMDTSEDQTGVLRGHSTSSDQGGVVWVRYGQFHLYSGTLDASDMVSKLNGTAVEVPKNSYFYMYGGKIIGGTAKYYYNESNGKYQNGLGGAISVSGKFVMYDGVIEGGKAEGVVTAWNTDGTPKTYERGIGGNIFAASGAVVEIYGGTIKNGTATHSGGNIYMDGTSTLLIEGGVISGGKVTGKGRNGGNVFITTKATLTMNGGIISSGISHNCGGNLYLNGTVIMAGGYITNGQIYNWSTGKLDPTANSRNVFDVNGTFYMYGGYIYGGFQAIDTDAEKTTTTILLSGYATIKGDVEGGNDLFLNNGGSGIEVIVGQMLDGATVGVNASTGVFTLPCAEHNTDNFFSNVEGAEVVWTEDGLALGRMGCVCGSNSEDPADHLGDCDGTQLFWAPWTGSSMPTQTGNYYLVKDLTNVGQGSMAADAVIHFDLNGYTITAKSGYRAISLHNPGTVLTICDSSEAQTGTMKSTGSGATQGNVVWVRYGEFTLYGGTLDGSGYQLYKYWNPGTDGVFGTEDDKEDDRMGGTVSMGGGTTFNMYGGTIIGNRMEGLEITKTVKTTEVVDGEEVTTTTEVKRTVGTNGGGSLYIPGNAVFNMYAGEIRDGYSADRGGNIYMAGSGIANLYGGVIKDGETAGYAGNIALVDTAQLNIMGATVSGGVAAKNGGSIWSSGGGTLLKMTSGLVENGKTTGDQGGNIFCSGQMQLLGGTITGGRVEKSGKTGGNICINSAKDILIEGATITDGYAAGHGGNISISTTNTAGSLTIGSGTVISGGEAATHGGNLYASPNNYNKNNPSVVMTMTGGTIENGTAGSDGGNIYIGTSGEGESSLTITGGTVTGGTAKTGGNIRIAGATVTVNGEDVLIEKGTTVNSGHGGNINTSGTFILKAGTVRDGVSSNTAGNIYANGSGRVVVEGGKILGGVDKNGANGGFSSIYVVSAALELRGGEMDGGIMVTNYGNNNGSVKMSGNPVIKSETRSGLNLSWGNGTNGTASHIPYIEIDGPMTEGAEVYITSTKWEVGKFTTETEESYTQYFHADDETRTIGYVNGCITLGKTYCVCGSTTEEHKPGCDGEQLFWTPWSSSTALPTVSGNYYLYTNVTLSGQAKTSEGQTIRLDLNGKTVENHADKNGIRLIWVNKSTMTITDTVGGGKLYNDSKYTQGGLIWVNGNSTLNIIAGTFDATDYISEYHSGGAAIAADNGTVNFYDGTVLSSQNSWYGSIMVGTTSTFNMYGGTVSGGKVTYNGGNVHVYGIMNMYGGTIENGYAAGNGGNIDVSTYTSNAGKENEKIYYGTLNLYGGTISGGTADNGGNIYVVANATMNIYGGTIENGSAVRENDANGDGGNICNFGTLTVSDGIVTGGSANNRGGNIHVQTGSMTMSGGTVSDGYAGMYDESTGKWTRKGWGGNIDVSAKGSLTISGGTISGGTSGGNGGNIRMSNDNGGATSLTMTGGTVTGGTSLTDHGGNIFTQCNTEITGGVISNGTANNGGNIGVNAGGKTITLKNVQITGGTANLNGGNIRLLGNAALAVNIGEGTVISGGVTKDASYEDRKNISINVSGYTVNFTDCTVEGYAGIEGTQTVTVTVSGKVVINGGENCTNNLKLGANTLTVGELTEGSSIGITADAGLFGTGTALTSDMAAYFTSDNADYRVALMEDGLHLVSTEATVYCICGATRNGGSHGAGCDGTEYVWAELTADKIVNNVIPAGNWYLSDKIEVQGQTKFSTGITRLDLNGQTLSRTKDRVLHTNGVSNATITITDTSAAQTGTLKADYTAGYKYANEGAGIWLTSNGTNTINWLNATIDCSAATVGKGGGAVYIASGNTFNFYSGKIIGGTASGSHGGAVHVTNGTFNMYGGTITGGKTATNNQGTETKDDDVNGHGGNVCLNNTKAVFNMYGGTISNGVGVQWAGNVYIMSGTFNMEGGTISGGKIGTNGNNTQANITIRAGGTLNISGGTIFGRINNGNANDTTATVNISGSAKILDIDDTPLNGNGIVVNVLVINLSNLNEDAQICFLNTTSNSEKKVANVLDDTVKVEMFGYRHYTEATGATDGALKIVNGELIGYIPDAE